jgi:3-hydroxyisobutyrate dehydrogenase-like beta-hydroxyacid dehydrogenase
MTDRSDEPVIAFIGAGQMGRPMARRLVEAGRDVVVHARREEVRSECRGFGATAVDTIPQAVRDANVIVVCLYSDAQIMELASGRDGFISSARPGALVVVHTTGSPATARFLADQGADRRVRVVEAPVSGSAEDIANGEVTVLLAGDPADVDAAHEIVSAYGDPILHLGPLGAAQVVKLLNNALLAANLQLVAEVERIASDFDVDWSEATTAILASSGASRGLASVQRMGSVAALVEAAGHYLAKDLAAGMDSARELGIDLGLLETINRDGPLDFVESTRSEPDPND